MSVQSFVPAVWSAMLLKQFDRVHVAAKGTNKDYEGDIKGYGSSVRINAIGDITVSSYTRNTDITAAEEIDMTNQVLNIDQGDVIHFGVDDLDKAQARADFMSRASQRATYALSQQTDYFLFTTIANGVSSANTLTAATIGLAAGEKSILEQLATMQVNLDEQDVPEDGRVAFLPPWTEAMLRLDERFTGFNTGDAQGPLKGTPIGRAMGFTIYKSNNLPRASGSPIAGTGSGAYTIIGCHPDATTFAEQMDTMRAYEPPLRFGDAVKGLHVYGAKVTRPHAITTLAATRGTLTV